MEDLKSTTLARPLDRNNMSNDAAALRTLVGFLNDPRVTGAAPPPANKPVVKPTPTPAARPTPPVPARKLATARSAAPKRLFFTGGAKVGKAFLAAQIIGPAGKQFGFDDPIVALAVSTFGEQSPASLVRFIAEVRGWGEGVVSDQLPLTAARAMFVENMRASGKEGNALFGAPVEGFGTKGFWASCLLARVEKYESETPGARIVVTRVTTPDNYMALKKAGFVPWHVTCNPMTRSARGGSNLVDNVSERIERDITSKLSQSGQGTKLWCVWSDDKYPVPSPRLFTVHEFLSEING